MTQPDDAPPLDEGTDITPEDADSSADTPASSDPDQMTDDAPAPRAGTTDAKKAVRRPGAGLRSRR